MIRCVARCLCRRETSSSGAELARAAPAGLSDRFQHVARRQRERHDEHANGWHQQESGASLVARSLCFCQTSVRAPSDGVGFFGWPRLGEPLSDQLPSGSAALDSERRVPPGARREDEKAVLGEAEAPEMSL